MQSETRTYRVDRLLGRGGFGAVYQAEMIGAGGFRKTVALKILNPEVAGSEDVARRMRDEARMLGRLRHRAIVQVDGLLQLDGRWTVVMEYVEGVDLRRIIEHGAVPAGCALEIVQEVAAALYVAYERPGPGGETLRLLHRDIKPGNIQLTSAGEVKVLDFGIARAEFTGREAETRSVLFGSVPYMSPERLDFEDNHASDVYAVGAVLYELLTRQMLGKTSAHEPKHAELLERAKATMQAQGVLPELAALVLDILAYDPEKRPSAKDLERRARLLRAKLPEPSLRDFAEPLVPTLGGGLPAEPDGISGSTLSETTTGTRTKAETQTVAAPSAGGRAVRAAGLGVLAIGGLGALSLAALVVLVGVALGANSWRTSGGPADSPPGGDGSEARVPAPPQEPAKVAAADLPAAIPAEPAKVEIPPEPAKVEVPPEAPVKPEPKKPEPKKAPKTPTSVVSVSGNAERVELRCGGATFLPGPVPLGECTAFAKFPSSDTFIEVGRVEVRAGVPVHIKCSSGFQLCAIR